MAALCFPALLSCPATAEDIDTEHLFAFMIGADVGILGEREFQSQTTGRFAKSGGRYRALEQEFELEFVPANNFRVEIGSGFAAHSISNVPGLEDRGQLGWQSASLDVRYRLLDRRTAPFGLTFGLDIQGGRIDETTGAVARRFGTGLTMALEVELVPNFAVAALNLIYQPEWTRFANTGVADQESTFGVAAGIMWRLRPDLLIGGEARYLRKYDGIGLDEIAGQALFVGPTAYLQLSERSRLTAAWSFQAWGRATGSTAALNLVDFERHQARIVFGVNF